MPQFLEIFQYIVDTNTSGVYIGKIDVTKHGGEDDHNSRVRALSYHCLVSSAAVGKHFHIKATPTFIL